MTEALMTITDIGRIYARSEGAIKTALWRHRRDQRDPGIPLPTVVGGRYRWHPEAVKKDFLERFGRELGT